MSRVLAYLGPSITLSRLMLEPAHNLVEQARNPREMHHADLNADGFGFGWYAPDNGATVYRRRVPIWHDRNLPDLARSLESDLWTAAVLHHDGPPGDGPPGDGPPGDGRGGLQPLRDDDLLFVHDGKLPRFDREFRDTVVDFIGTDAAYGLNADAPADLLFAVLRTLFLSDENLGMEAVIGRLYEFVDDWVSEGSAQLNLLTSDGERLYVGRHAVRADCPTLYYTTDDDAFPDAQVVASEPLTDSDFWHPVPEGSVLILDPEEPPELIALEAMPER
jgi:glutamine amidotransferase